MGAVRVAALTLILMIPGLAQINRGGIRGTLADPSGAAVPTAQVEAQNLDTGVPTVVVSGDFGAFTFASLLPGRYRVTTSVNGFKKAVVDGVVVQIGQVTRLDIILQLGNVGDQIEVTDATVAVNPDSAQAGTVLTSKEYDNLPLAATTRVRSPTDFALLTPGVLGSQQRPGESATATTSISLDGGAGGATDILVDGMSAGQISSFGSFTEVAPPVDAIAEFNIIKGAFSAEYGYVRTGLISFSLKSGTNQVHGSLFENFRNTKLNARAFFEAEKLPFHQNNFGGTVTAPFTIPGLYKGKDRTFLMVSSDNGSFRGASQIVSFTSPTSAFLRGDFSTLKTAQGALRLIYDPASSTPDGKGGVTRTPFVGNIIQPNRISSIARQVADLYPAPNRLGNDSNFVGRGGAVFLNNYYFNTKIDHRFNEKHSISSSFNYTFLPRRTQDNPYEGTVLLAGLVQDFSSENFRLTHDFVIRPSILNHWQVGYNRWLNPVRSYSFVQTPDVNWPAKLGIKGVGGADGTLPVFQFTSDAYPTVSSPRYDFGVEENIMFQNTTTVLHGKHSIKFGFEARSQWIKPRDQRNQNGTFLFNSKETALAASATTGNAFASFLLGYADGGNISSPLNVASHRPYYAFFVQEDWKLSQKVTLNLGLRYDLELPPYEQYGRASLFDLSTPNPAAGNRAGALIYAGSGSGRIGDRSFEDTHRLNFAPRLGLAYNLRKGTVLRAGYGISYSSSQLTNSYLGFSTTANFISADNGNTPAFRLEGGMPTNWPKPPFIDPAFGNNNNVTTSIRPEAARMPMTQIWRFDVQHELPGATVLELAYVGTRGTHLTAPGLTNLNQVDAKYLSLGSVLNANVTSAAAQQAGIQLPYSGFTGTVRQALRPYPQVLTITSAQDKGGSSEYHSFQVKVQKRFAKGLQYLVSYTNSKLMTDVQDGLAGISASTLQDAGNRRAEWAVAGFDTPQNLWMSVIYELPFGPGKSLLTNSTLAGKVLGGWSVSAAFNYQSGVPLRITQSNTMALFNGGQRPDRVLGTAARNDIAYTDFDPATNRLFNPAAFQLAGSGAFGNASPHLDDARGFGIRREDVSARKNIRLREHWSFELNVQAFNVFNNNQWGRASDDASSSQFGKITLAGPGRFVQIGAKMRF